MPSFRIFFSGKREEEWGGSKKVLNEGVATPAWKNALQVILNLPSRIRKAVELGLGRRKA